MAWHLISSLDKRGVADFDELIHKKNPQNLEVLSYSFILWSDNVNWNSCISVNFNKTSRDPFRGNCFYPGRFNLLASVVSIHLRKFYWTKLVLFWLFLKQNSYVIRFFSLYRLWSYTPCYLRIFYWNQMLSYKRNLAYFLVWRLVLQWL